MAIKVNFRTAKLRRCFNKSQEAIRAWGDKVGRNYVKRIKDIEAAAKVEDLYKLPHLGFHPLREDRKGQYAVELGYRARMIVTVTQGGKIEIVTVQEVDQRHYEN